MQSICCTPSCLESRDMDTLLPSTLHMGAVIGKQPDRILVQYRTTEEIWRTRLSARFRKQVLIRV